MPEADGSIVVNTGPLLALGVCGQTVLLPRLHSPVIVPQAVAGEFERLKPDDPVRPSSPAWAAFEVRPHAAPSPMLRAYLDEGEAAVISLAQESGVRLVAIDERRGRLIAKMLGLRVTGSVGMLLRAKRLGLLSHVRPSLEAMRAGGVWLSDRLVALALREAGEA